MSKHEVILGSRKFCTGCNKYKPFSEFHRSDHTKSGLRNPCKLCRQSKWRKFKDRSDRFWKFFRSRTEKVGNCLEWTGTYTKANRTGQPSCSFDGKKMVRRVVYVLAIGELTEEMVVKTTCNNNRCVLQSHMIAITKEELNTIMCNSVPTGDQNPRRTHPERYVHFYGDGNWTRRHPERVRRGEVHPKAKLTEQDVKQIRLRESSYNDMAQRYGVAKSTIERIVHRKIWSHVE